jgi:hypothetical protein
MNTVTMPGFTAATSVYKSTGCYQSAGRQSDTTLTVVPQLRISQFPVQHGGLKVQSCTGACAAISNDCTSECHPSDSRCRNDCNDFFFSCLGACR